jgi:hypothetical protein
VLLRAGLIAYLVGSSVAAAMVDVSLASERATVERALAHSKLDLRAERLAAELGEELRYGAPPDEAMLAIAGSLDPRSHSVHVRWPDGHQWRLGEPGHDDTRAYRQVFVGSLAIPVTIELSERPPQPRLSGARPWIWSLWLAGVGFALGLASHVRRRWHELIAVAQALGNEPGPLPGMTGHDEFAWLGRRMLATMQLFAGETAANEAPLADDRAA